MIIEFEHEGEVTRIEGIITSIKKTGISGPLTKQFFATGTYTGEEGPVPIQGTLHDNLEEAVAFVLECVADNFPYNITLGSALFDSRGHQKTIMVEEMSISQP